MNTHTNPLIRVTDNTAYNLHHAVELFLEDAQARGLRPATLRFYRQLLTAFANRVNLPLEEVTQFLVRRYLIERQQDGVSGHTLHADYRALRAFFRWLHAEELIATNPMERVKFARPDVICKHILTEEEIRKILDACRGSDWLRRRDYALVLTLLDTGLRVGELVQMTVRDGMSETFLVRGKSRRDRLVCLSAETRMAIRKYLQALPFALDADSPLWQGVAGALTAHGVQEAVQRIGKRAGLPQHLGCHVFRRSFAIYSLRSGMSLEHLRALLGHTDFQMLKHYVHLLEDDLKQAHQQHGALKKVLHLGKKR